MLRRFWNYRWVTLYPNTFNLKLRSIQTSTLKNMFQHLLCYSAHLIQNLVHWSFFLGLLLRIMRELPVYRWKQKTLKKFALCGCSRFSYWRPIYTELDFVPNCGNDLPLKCTGSSRLIRTKQNQVKILQIGQISNLVCRITQQGLRSF